MGGFSSAAYWRFGDTADGWVGVIDRSDVVGVPLCLSLVNANGLRDNSKSLRGR